MFVTIQTFTGGFVPVHGMFPVGIAGGLLYWVVHAPFGVPAVATVLAAIVIGFVGRLNGVW